jgi:hypothetical protein
MKNRIFITLVLFLFIGFSAQSVETPYYAKKAKDAPIIDADSTDSCWAKADWKTIDQLWIGSAAKSNDFTGRFKVVWTPDKLYFLVEITDDSLNYKYPGNCNNIHNFDCIEIFLDEDHSGGNHQYNFNAFAYHINENGDVCDLGTDQANHLFTNDVQSKFDTIGEDRYLWEVAIKVFADDYVYGGNNTPVTLTENKILGMSVAYNDNDGGTTRQNMFGSVFIAGTDKNVSWINASYFGSMQLIDSIIPEPIDTTSPVKVMPAFNKLQSVWNINAQTLNFNYYDGQIGTVSAQLIDITGKTVKSIQVYKTTNQLDGSIQLIGIPRGAYFLRLISGNNFYTSKVVIN